MTTEKMSVHKALCELKVLDSRIIKAIDECQFCFANKKANVKVKGMDVAKYCEEIKSAYQRARDLIARRDAIKRAVVNSNAVTKVVIGGVEYTVAEAIDMKNHGMELMEYLLDHMADRLKVASSEAERVNGQIEARADDYIKSMFGATDVKGATDEIVKAREDFIKSQTCEVVDPIGAKKEMDDLAERVSAFKIDVDSALSVSNAVTEITIEY